MNDSNKTITEIVEVHVDLPRIHRNLTYAYHVKGAWASWLIQAVEWLTGKPKLLRAIRKSEKVHLQVGNGRRTFKTILEALQVSVETPDLDIENIPSEGPVVVVANHPHGDIDALVVADIIARQRSDFRILGRSGLFDSLDLDQFFINVPFPHEADVQRKAIEMRTEAMRHLSEGGVVMLFPAGAIASSRDLFGTAEEAEWNPFPAQLIRRSGATVVPIYIPGSNARSYQIAARVSPFFAKALLLSQITRLMNSTMRLTVGKPLGVDFQTKIGENPRSAMSWLRSRTLSLRIETPKSNREPNSPDDDENTDDPGPMISKDGKDL